MMWRISPGVAVGPLRLGMQESEYVEILGRTNAVFKRVPESSEDILAYGDAGLHLCVNEDGAIVQISVFQPKQVALVGVQLLGRDLVTVKEELERTEFKFEPINVGLWCERAGIVLVEVDGIVDGVEVRAIHESR